MSTKRTALQEKRNKLVSDMVALNRRAETEHRDLTKDEDESFNRMDAEVQGIDKELGELRALEAGDKARREAQERRTAQLRALRMRPASADEQEQGYRDWLAAMRQFLVGGRETLRPEHVQAFADVRDLYRAHFMGNGADSRALEVGTAASAGNLTHPDFQASLLAAMEVLNPFMSLCDSITTSTGSDLIWPTIDDLGAEATIITETQSHAEQDPGAVGQLTLKAWQWSSGYVKVSLMALQDSLIPLDTLLYKLLSDRFSRGLRRRLTEGNGTAEPQGVTTALAAAVAYRKAAGASAITYDDIIDLFHAVAPYYRNGAVFMFHDDIVASLRKLKDANNTPMWQPSLQDGQPDRLIGRAFYPNEYLARAPQSGAVSMLFGNFKSIMLRYVSGMEIVRLNELGALSNQVYFLGRMRMDGRPMWPQADVSKSITASAIASNVLSATAANHGLRVGDWVITTGLTTNITVPVRVASVPTANTFTAPLTAANAADNGTAGAVVNKNKGRPIMGLIH